MHMGIKGLCVIFLMTTGLASILLSLLPSLSFLIPSSLRNSLTPPNHPPQDSRHADVGVSEEQGSQKQRDFHGGTDLLHIKVSFFRGRLQTSSSKDNISNCPALPVLLSCVICLSRPQ